MAKEIVTWCDAHLTRDEQVPAESIRLAIGLTPPVEVDLCEACQKELVEPVALFAAEHGQPVKVPEAGLSCQVCGKQYQQHASLQRHMSKVHEDSTSSSSSVVVKDGYPCPDCERVFDRPQALGRHRTHAHDYVGEKTKAKAKAK